jgi:acetylornithine deacetylase/succinyl-diaminopimelate desuccinylase-like protein
LNYIDLASRAIAIDSTPQQGNAAAAQFYANEARALGLKAQIFRDHADGVGQGVVVISHQDNLSDIDFAVITPIDTTEPGDFSRWTKSGGNPFVAATDGQVLFGLGAARGKASLCVQIMALKNQKQSRWAIIGVHGAESGAGYLYLHRKKILNPKAVIVTHPTNMNIVLRAAGYARIELAIPFSEEEKLSRAQIETTVGATTNSKIFFAPKSSNIDYLDNPIVQMMDYFKKLPESLLILSADGGTHHGTTPESVWLEVDIGSQIDNGINTKLLKLHEATIRAAYRMRAIKASDFYPEHSTFNIGTIRTYADGIKMSGSCRLVPTDSLDVYKNWLSLFKEEVSLFGGVMDLVEYREPMSTGLESQWVNELSRDLNLEISKNGASCNSGNLTSRLGIPTVLFGPGVSRELTAQANESIDIDSLDRATALYEKIFSGAYI